MPVILRFTLFLLLGLSISGPALADPLPLSSVLEKMPGKSLADVKAQAQTESGAGPTWGNSPDPSALPFHQTFTGTVTADATMTKLAIFSDDGCDVTVDGAKVWSAKDQGQALPDLANSLHELSVTLTPGDHTVQIDYSNTVYTVADPAKGIPPDIDGCTLFQYSPAPTVPAVTVQPGQFSPNPAGVGTQMTASLSATVKDPPQSTSDTTITGPTWGWKTQSVETSQDGTSFATATPDSYTITISQSDPTKPDASFAVTFSQPAFYRIQVTATATYHSTPTNGSAASDLTPSGTDYILGVGPAPASGSSQAASPSVSTAHAAIAPHAAGDAPSNTPATSPGQLAVAASLQILRDGKDVTNSVVNVMVGEGIGLTAQVKPSMYSILYPPTVFDVGSTWQASGAPAVGGYAASASSGGSLPLGPSSGSYFHLYWASGLFGLSSAPQVTLSNPLTPFPPTTVTFLLNTPNASVEATQGVASVNQDYDVTPGWNAHLAHAYKEPYGIHWTFHLDDSKGKYQWTQIITDNGVTYNEKGNTTLILHRVKGSGPAYPQLDTQVSYHGTSFTDNGTDSDAPADELTTAEKSMKNTGMKFVDYLMFRPSTSDSCWVPLGTMSWSWGASATNIMNGKNYTDTFKPINAGDLYPSSPQTPQFTPGAPGFPAWQCNFTDMGF